jgi:allantoicase
MQQKFDSLVDLISQRNGGYVMGCSDEFFAEASNLLKKGRGVWKEGKYTGNHLI